jgi:hypothetical protein
MTKIIGARQLYQGSESDGRRAAAAMDHGTATRCDEWTTRR